MQSKDLNQNKQLSEPEYSHTKHKENGEFFVKSERKIVCKRCVEENPKYTPEVLWNLEKGQAMMKESIQTSKESLKQSMGELQSANAPQNIFPEPQKMNEFIENCRKYFQRDPKLSAHL